LVPCLWVNFVRQLADILIVASLFIKGGDSINVHFFASKF